MEKFQEKFNIYRENSRTPGDHSNGTWIAVLNSVLFCPIRNIDEFSRPNKYSMPGTSPHSDEMSELHCLELNVAPFAR